MTGTEGQARRAVLLLVVVAIIGAVLGGVIGFVSGQSYGYIQGRNDVFNAINPPCGWIQSGAWPVGPYFVPNGWTVTFQNITRFFHQSWVLGAHGNLTVVEVECP